MAKINDLPLLSNPTEDMYCLVGKDDLKKVPWSAIMGQIGAPYIATTVAGMTDKTRVYVYQGSESGYTSGNWYYWNGSAWTSGGTYNSAVVDTDKTLTQSDKPADSAVVGQEIGSLKESLDGIGYNMNLFDDTKIEKNKAYITKEGNKIGIIDSTQNSRLKTAYRVNPGDVIYVERWWSFVFIFTDDADKIITSMSGEPLTYTVPDNSDIAKMYVNVSNVAIERGIMFNINHALPDERVTYNTFSIPSYETKKINEDIGKINEDIGKINEDIGKINEDIGKNEGYYYFYNNVIPAKTRYIAHRGYNHSAPENSLPAFENAGKLGAWGIETDLQNTSDGQIVIMHDNTVDNMTNGTGNVINMTFEEIRKLKIDTGNNVGDYNDSELIVPTLEEYLEICKKYGCVAIIELKRFSNENHVDTVVSKIVEMGMTHSCIVISFNASWIEKVRKLNEQIHTSILLDSFSDSDIEKYKNYKNFTLSIPHASLTEDLAKMTHKYNLLINTYTIYNNNLTDALIDKGCDFITINTDKVS